MMMMIDDDNDDMCVLAPIWNVKLKIIKCC